MVNHDTSKIPLARSRRNNGNSTMLLTVDSEGLAIRVDLDTENNLDARALYSAVERGDIDGMSFAMSVRGDKWDDLESEHPTRRITDIGSIVEVSAVNFPAYAATTIDARSKEALIDTSKHLILECAHPSPLSAYNGFFGCRHFSKTNEYLTANGIAPIDWDLTK